MCELQTFLRDKPYEFVPLLEQCKRTKYSSHNRMERGTYSGKLKLKMEILSPLHIGSKQQEYDENGNVMKSQMRRNGNIVIPGSSFKGAVRAIAEAVSYSCAVKLPDVALKKILPPENNEPCLDINKGLCITCSIFGMMSKAGSYKGKVDFGEFVFSSGSTKYEEIPSLESPFKNYPDPHDVFGNRSHYGNERLYYCKACEEGNCQDCRKEDYFRHIEAAGTEREMGFRGRKFYSTEREKQIDTNGGIRCEMIKPGSIMEGEILFQNLREEEGRLLMYALDIGHSFTMKLGYGKPLGYGKVKIKLSDVESIGIRYPSEKVINRDIIERWAQEYKSDSPEEIKKVINEFERIMK